MVDSPQEMESAIGPRTAMIYMMSDRPESTDPLSLEAVAKIAAAKNIPILVDAAAENLTIPCVHLERGATVVAYSGGKAIRGPQCAGLLRRKDRCRRQASAPITAPDAQQSAAGRRHAGRRRGLVGRDHEVSGRTGSGLTPSTSASYDRRSKTVWSSAWG
jgi:selenocysteine lyase/cysteine desulfurase